MKHYRFEDAAVVLAGAQAAREYFEPIFLERKQEITLAAFCDHRLRVLQLLAFPGDEDSSLVSVKDVLSHAFGCAGIVLAHNHPSGDPQPSKADLRLTRRLCLFADAIDITIFDHLIFGSGSMVSMRQEGWM